VVAPHPFSETDSVFPDLIPDQGPLGGLFTALSHLKSTGLVLLSCDMPFLPMHRVEPFLAYQGPGPLVPVFQGRRHPFPAWFPASCLPEVRLRIERGQLRMEDFLASQSCTELFWETDFQNHPEWFAHFNKPEDLHHYLAKWNPHT
jgi:molybdopterin-guanine dinucleotide biosynthesis protein A